MKQYRILVVGGSGAVDSELSKQLSDDGKLGPCDNQQESYTGGWLSRLVDLLTDEGMTNAFVLERSYRKSGKSRRGCQGILLL